MYYSGRLACDGGTVGGRRHYLARGLDYIGKRCRDYPLDLDAKLLSISRREHYLVSPAMLVAMLFGLMVMVFYMGVAVAVTAGDEREY